MLPRDANHWKNLVTAFGNAEDVPSLLQAVEEGEDVWAELYGSLCPQDIPYEAAFAAVPHIVAIAATCSADERVDHLAFVGVVAAADVQVPSRLAADYRQALTRGVSLVNESLAADLQIDDAEKLVWAALAMRGIQPAAWALSTFVNRLTIQTRCPGEWCGVELWLDHDGDAWAPLVVAGDERGPSTQITPPADLEVGAEWTIRNAPAQMAALAETHGYSSLAEKLRLLMGTARCPKCSDAFELWPEILEPSEL